LIDLTAAVVPPYTCLPPLIHVQLLTAKLWKQVLKSLCLLYIPQTGIKISSYDHPFSLNETRAYMCLIEKKKRANPL
jgi:hypothetical protein